MKTQLTDLTFEDMCVMHRFSLKWCRSMQRADERDYKIFLRYRKRSAATKALKQAWGA